MWTGTLNKDNSGQNGNSSDGGNAIFEGIILEEMQNAIDDLAKIVSEHDSSTDKVTSIFEPELDEAATQQIKEGVFEEDILIEITQALGRIKSDEELQELIAQYKNRSNDLENLILEKKDKKIQHEMVINNVVLKTLQKLRQQDFLKMSLSQKQMQSSITNIQQNMLKGDIANKAMMDSIIQKAAINPAITGQTANIQNQLPQQVGAKQQSIQNSQRIASQMQQQSSSAQQQASRQAQINNVAQLQVATQAVQRQGQIQQVISQSQQQAAINSANNVVNIQTQMNQQNSAQTTATQIDAASRAASGAHQCHAGCEHNHGHSQDAASKAHVHGPGCGCPGHSHEGHSHNHKNDHGSKAVSTEISCAKGNCGHDHSQEKKQAHSHGHDGPCHSACGHGASATDVAKQKSLAVG